MERFSELLKSAYAGAYNTTWREPYSLRKDEVNHQYFEINDREHNIIQREGEGVARFYNPQGEQWEIIDFEHFVNQFTQRLEAGKGKKCDFILAPLEHQDFIVLNELSHLHRDSLHHFKEEDEGWGKLEKAFAQLSSSIEKLYRSQEIASRLDATKRKVGLFSARLKEPVETTRENDAALHSISTFLKPLAEQPIVVRQNSLPHGFDFVRVFYPHAFQLSPAI